MQTKLLAPDDNSSDSFFFRDFQLRPREPGIGRLRSIPIHENGEPLVPLAGISPRIRLKSPLPWVRASVAGMLVQAAEKLPAGINLLVFTALRTMKMQTRSYQRYFRLVARQHPEWPKAILHREVNRFMHPPDPATPPGHCTGGAVDVRLVFANGHMVDTNSGEIAGEQTWVTFYRHLTERAQANRALLYDTMLSVGFSNCYDEWWHYTYGDPTWAARLGKPYAIYGITEEYPEALQELITRVEKLPPRKPKW
jgi:zinc D-Ala-D-Ala dipeptidase